MHLTAPLTNSPVQGFLRDVALSAAAQVRHTADPAASKELIARVRAGYDALPDSLKHLALDTLRAHAVFANDAQERIDAERALNWLVTA